MKPRLAIYFFLPVILIGFVIHVFSRPATQKPKAVKIAELGDEGEELYSAYLDDLAGRLKQDPTAKGLIIAYGPEGNGSGTGKYIMDQCRAYLEKRGAAKRIITIYGGPAKSAAEVGMEYWFLPSGAEQPRPSMNHRTVFSGLFGGGIRHEVPMPTDNGCCDLDLGYVQIAGFADTLRHQTNDIGYIVTHQSSEDAPGAWRRIADTNVELLNEYGISSDRLKIVYGGADQSSDCDLWVLPKNEPLPIKEAVPSRLADKAMLVQSYDEYDLADSGIERRGFKAIADLLREYPDAKVCYMVMPPAQSDTGEEQSRIPKVKFRQIVESWRTRLISELKISPDRIVVFYVPGVSVQLPVKMMSWIVPKNAAMPSPPKEDDDDPPIYRR